MLNFIWKGKKEFASESLKSIYRLTQWSGGEVEVLPVLLLLKQQPSLLMTHSFNNLWDNVNVAFSQCQGATYFRGL